LSKSKIDKHHCAVQRERASQNTAHGYVIPAMGVCNLPKAQQQHDSQRHLLVAKAAFA
jgi:hypothetical protein